MELKITYNFWNVVWNIRVCAKSMYFVKKHTTHFGILFVIPGTSAAIERAVSLLEPSNQR
jgi:hypothetical protein